MADELLVLRPDYYAFAPPDNLSEEELELRRQVIILVQQFCIMGKNVQVAAWMVLLRSLVDRGVLFGVQWAMSLAERDPVNKPMISAAGEILMALVDHTSMACKNGRAGRRARIRRETTLEMVCRILA
ncbi:hypothetical protein DXG01_000857 [Tephrocybe rancida]|nr:hypothetical protein DXG01_000857 [Tephrocybe rancida]